MVAAEFEKVPARARSIISVDVNDDVSDARLY